MKTQIERLTTMNTELLLALAKCERHFQLLARLAEARSIKDQHKRPKWKIVEDEAKFGERFAASFNA